jgi:hypothetical protein
MSGASAHEVLSIRPNRSMSRFARGVCSHAACCLLNAVAQRSPSITFDRVHQRREAIFVFRCMT